MVEQVARPVRSASSGEVCCGPKGSSINDNNQAAANRRLAIPPAVTDRRALTTAVVAGSATGVLAAPASAPHAEVAISHSLAPVLYGKATAAGSGTQSIRFSARTAGASTWNLLDAVSVTGTEAFRLVAGREHHHSAHLGVRVDAFLDEAPPNTVRGYRTDLRQ